MVGILEKKETCSGLDDDLLYPLLFYTNLYKLQLFITNKPIRSIWWHFEFRVGFVKWTIPIDIIWHFTAVNCYYLQSLTEIVIADFYHLGGYFLKYLENLWSLRYSLSFAKVKTIDVFKKIRLKY